MAASIKASMGVDGASKFRSEMKDAKTSVRELDSELKLAESQFKLTGDKEQFMSDKSKILKEQIDAQEKVVGLLKDQLSKTAEKYGANSTEASKLKTELNKAQTQQNKLKDALNAVEDPLKTAGTDTGTLASNAGDAAKSTGDLDSNLQNVAAHLDLQAVANFADNIASAIEAAAQKAKELAVQVWNLGSEAGQTADTWLTMSKTTGFSVEELQKYAYAGRFVDTTLENITGSMEKFKKSTDDAKSVNNLRKFLGATRKEMEEMSRNDMFWATIDKIGEMYQGGNVKGAEDAAMQWFGRSASNMNPLFEAGRENFEALGEEAQQLGYILGQEDVEALGAFDDQNQKLQASIDALKLSLAEELLPLLTPIAEGFTKISDSMLQWLQSDEGKQAVSDLSKAIGDVFDSMSGDIPSAVESATTLVTNFAQGFTDAETAVNKVIDAVKILAGVWAASKLVSFGSSMVSASQSIGNFFGKLLAGIGGAGAGAGTAAAAGSGAGTATAAATGGGFFSSLLGSTGAKILGGTGAFFTTLFGNMIKQDANTAQEKAAASQEFAGLDQGTMNQVVMHARESGDTLKEAEKIIVDNMREWQVTAEQAANQYVFGGEFAQPINGEDTGEKAEDTKQLAYETEVYADALARLDAAMNAMLTGGGDQWLRDSLKELQGADIENVFTEDVIKGIMNLDDIPTDMFASWASKLRDQLAQAAGEASEGVGEGAKEGASYDDMKKTGSYAMDGLARGILSGEIKVRGAAKKVSKGAVDEIKSDLKVASPSKVMAEIGAFVAEGFAQGIENGTGTVSGAVDNMLGVVNRSPVYGSSASYGSGADADTFIAALNGALVQMDGETVGRLIFPYINAETGKTQQRRYA